MSLGRGRVSNAGRMLGVDRQHAERRAAESGTDPDVFSGQRLSPSPSPDTARSVALPALGSGPSSSPRTALIALWLLASASRTPAPPTSVFTQPYTSSRLSASNRNSSTALGNRWRDSHIPTAAARRAMEKWIAQKRVFPFAHGTTGYGSLNSKSKRRPGGGASLPIQ
jgi:hypothetical protein